MTPARPLDLIERVAHLHRGGHRCTDGAWYNNQAGSRIACPTLTFLTSAADAVRALHAQVHEAAHKPDAVDHVMAAMLSTPVEDIEPDVLEGWREVTRYGIEALSEYLDRDETPEARRAEAAAALIHERAGIITQQ